MKRIIDVLAATFGIVLLAPILLIISLLIKFSSKGPVLFKQLRVGKSNRDFKIFKFRTMYTDSDRKGLLTVGSRDSRITPIGYYLRKYKLDELPQLFNVLFGSMSLVGPRPEVRKYVEYYSESDLEILSVKPGITDFASIEFRNENDLLKVSEDPEKKYIHDIMPAKIKLNKKYIENYSVITDFNIIFRTIAAIIYK